MCMDYREDIEGKSTEVPNRPQSWGSTATVSPSAIGQPWTSSQKNQQSSVEPPDQNSPQASQTGREGRDLLSGQASTLYNPSQTAVPVNDEVQQSLNQSSAQQSSLITNPGTTEKEESIAMKDYRKQSERFKKEREVIKAREVDTSLSKRLGALATPFIFLTILCLIVVFIFIPYSTEVVETRKNTRALLKDIRRNEDKIDILTGIDLTELDRHLEVASTVIRDRMDVTEMAIEVERLALAHNLVPRQQKTSNMEDVVMQSTTVETEWVPSYADVISGPFDYEGSFADITGFIKDLRNNSKTILSLGRIQMNRITHDEDDLIPNEQDHWFVSLLVSGYTAKPITSAIVADPVRTDIDSQILQQIYSRAGESYGTDDEIEYDTEESSDGETEGEDLNILQ